MNDKNECKSCHKMRVIYSNGFCQKCYRENFKNRKENTKKIYNFEGLNNVHKMVVEKYQSGFTVKEIKQYLESQNIELTTRNIYYIIQRNVRKVIENGH